MLAGVSREVAEVRREVDRGERVVEEQRIVLRDEHARLAAERRLKTRTGGPDRGCLREQLAGRGHARRRVVDALELDREHVAQRLTRAMAGQHVVTHVCDAAR